MTEFRITAHIQARMHDVVVAPSDAGPFEVSAGGAAIGQARTLAQAESMAIEEIRRYWGRHLRRSDLQWGLRVSIPCGTFSFGDWSFEPLRGGGGGFRPDEPIIQIFRKWSERDDPQSALTGARQLIQYCLGRGLSGLAAAA